MDGRKETGHPMRTFIRHPAEAPISYSLKKDEPVNIQKLKDLGHGGLSFYTNENIPVGTIMQITIPNLKYHFCEEGVVVWSRPYKGHYQVGVKFSNDKSAYRMRMIEQICYIDAYRRKIKSTQNKDMSWKEASDEWIKKYARAFPALED